jgi:(2S)-methylsuccinyl-CoA dehydrogenase
MSQYVPLPGRTPLWRCGTRSRARARCARWRARSQAAGRGTARRPRPCVDRHHHCSPRQPVGLGRGRTGAQLVGGLPISANEIVRPAQLGINAVDLAADPALAALIETGGAPATRAALVAHVRNGGTVAESLGDDMIDTIRDQYRRFTAEKITPFAHAWHLADELIPDALISERPPQPLFRETR